MKNKTFLFTALLLGLLILAAVVLANAAPEAFEAAARLVWSG